MDNIFDKIKPCLSELNNISRYIGGEYNSAIKDTDKVNFNFCMCYPDIYDIGQSNQAIRILSNCINKENNFFAQRAFLPDPKAKEVFVKNNIPMYSLESFSPLKQFDAIGITVSHDLIATNILELLDFAEIPLHTKDRTLEDPFVFGGGPMYCNPEPYHKFFDIICIGEGEVALVESLKKLNKLKNNGLDREAILHEMAKIDSLYIPSMYVQSNNGLIPKYDDVPKRIKKAIYKEFSDSYAYDNCIVSFTESVHNRLNVEILRGCARSCRFCQAGIMYRPIRERNKENIIDSVVEGLKDTGYDEVSLTSLSSTDHSQIKEILKDLNTKFENKGIRVSLPSQRMDAFGMDMAKLVAGQKKGGLTFAIEAGTQRLRNVINKNVEEKDIFTTIEYAFKNGWNRAKLYFMIGLPTETDNDVVQIANLSEKILDCAKNSVENKRKHGVSISISCAVFVPKAQTPFMWDGQISIEECIRRINLIRSNLKSKQISFSWHDPYSSFIEAIISRGSRDCANLIEQAWKNGAKFDAWKEHFNFEAWCSAAKKVNMDIKKIAEANFEIGTKMPWDHIDLGVSYKYFKTQRILADKEIVSEDCTFGKCDICGACSAFSFSNKLAQPRK